jgi:vacuolar-type H+-ATPase subunit D/Vma8
MSVLTQAIDAIKEALKLTDEVRRAGETLKDLAQEIRDHDRRITQLEAQWETAAMLSRRRLE